jgi:hypothetical protein
MLKAGILESLPGRDELGFVQVSQVVRAVQVRRLASRSVDLPPRPAPRTDVLPH